MSAPSTTTVNPTSPSDWMRIEAVLLRVLRCQKTVQSLVQQHFQQRTVDISGVEQTLLVLDTEVLDIFDVIKDFHAGQPIYGPGRKSSNFHLWHLARDLRETNIEYLTLIRLLEMDLQYIHTGPLNPHAVSAVLVRLGRWCTYHSHPYDKDGAESLAVYIERELEKRIHSLRMSLIQVLAGNTQRQITATVEREIQKQVEQMVEERLAISSLEHAEALAKAEARWRSEREDLRQMVKSMIRDEMAGEGGRVAVERELAGKAAGLGIGSAPRPTTAVRITPPGDTLSSAGKPTSSLPIGVIPEPVGPAFALRLGVAGPRDVAGASMGNANGKGLGGDDAGARDMGLADGREGRAVGAAVTLAGPEHPSSTPHVGQEPSAAPARVIPINNFTPLADKLSKAPTGSLSATAPPFLPPSLISADPSHGPLPPNQPSLLGDSDSSLSQSTDSFDVVLATPSGMSSSTHSSTTRPVRRQVLGYQTFEDEILETVERLTGHAEKMKLELGDQDEYENLTAAIQILMGIVERL